MTDAAGGEPEGEEYMLKILVVGDVGSGKTAIIKRFVHNIFSHNYKATIGVDFALKVIQLKDATVRIQLWDIAGQERFGNMTRVYYRDAVGAIVVYSQKEESTFENVIKWKADLDSKLDHIPVVLFANKSDAVDEGKHPDKVIMDAYCMQHAFIGWTETSAKTGAGLTEGVDLLLTKLVKEMAPPPPPPPKNTVQLNLTEKKGEGGCCH